MIMKLFYFFELLPFANLIWPFMIGSLYSSYMCIFENYYKHAARSFKLGQLIKDDEYSIAGIRAPSFWTSIWLWHSV